MIAEPENNPHRGLSTRRKVIRLRGHDYSQPGAYFVTVCIRDKKPLLGDVTRHGVTLTDLGRCVETVWNTIPDHHPDVNLDEYVIMPDHMHGVILLGEANAGDGERPPPTLGAVVGSFKSAATRSVNQARGTSGVTLWQRGFYEHIVRNQHDLDDIREYIRTNPLRWWLRSHGS